VKTHFTFHFRWNTKSDVNNRKTRISESDSLIKNELLTLVRKQRGFSTWTTQWILAL